MLHINLSTYEKPCIKCGAQDRLPPRGKHVTGDCRPCTKTRARRTYEISPGKFISRSHRYALANPEKVAAYKANWVDKNPEKRKAAARKYQHNRRGWVPGEHEKAEAALAAGIKECACCKSTEPRNKLGWAADHNFKSGMFRGHLCHQCNIIVGWIERGYLMPEFYPQQKNYLSAK